MFEGSKVIVTAKHRDLSREVLSPTLLLLDGTSVHGDEIPLRSATYFGFLAAQASVNISTASSASRILAREWIRECTQNHPRCVAGGFALPTRLINITSVKGSQKVAVVQMQRDSSRERIKYIALSYCWGRNTSLKLETATHEELTAGVLLTTLPRTVQDTVRFTEYINVKWLWVDALYIIQDQKHDWHGEAARMQQVYQNAFLTIGALGASDSDTGLYALRDPLLYSPCYILSTRQGETIYTRQHNMTFSGNKEIWPLHRRGWVMQERILAPRTLNFGPYLIWQYQEKLVDEYSIISGSSTVNYKGLDLSRSFSSLITHGGTHLMSSTDYDMKILDMWSKIVAQYTSNHLTVSTDR
jgi:hypothetical protein